MDSILEKAAVKRAQAAIDKHGISGKIKILTDSARTAAEAAAGLGIEVGQIASSLVFKLPDQRSLLVITSGRHRVDTQMVTDLLHVQALDRADADYVKEISGYSVGGVAPLGWINEPSITLIDEVLSDYQVIWAAAGHPHAVFPTTYQELLEASGAKAARVGN
ncbi:MAG: aminoacyl-tRNA deacylase [Actinobacteria bacterium BACL2 MAG-121001-bin67]|jgi:prolyl-tRNA editing enzyme YbaK/EbsC (Cys-tRNA(Pro) deacylase)|uniref:Aminoacyl-tRNA deacylase n=2 Tax=ac1 cluster TaxID=1655545 RepID=A0A0R2P1H5_9ACTN|nr:MAG: aminoacyl-tRNA deacylase [Actinobacteria bacterium BACL2 MAG-121001-bin67]KRO72049.1 MAG: aminoacyl-tRNA deacylase [Actinobacteria bacterium BACL2 MAG-120920-bin34]KRP30799.1 MAG: aminoacyl-tRNA deacylase [Actinobacteria bacterium BACL2 MAG-120507-bin38]HAG54235.1 aminoacyl-tRNA deacylase [Actinomycetota bacterium]